jgi:hypothetical protein
MHNRLWLAAILATTPILVMSPAAFPAKEKAGCVRSTADARRQQRHFMSLMRSRGADTDRELRMFALPHVRPREVTRVSDDEICRKAAVAYTKSVRDLPDLRVHVLHIGGRFVVADAKQHRSLTFDSTFSRPLAAVER